MLLEQKTLSKANVGVLFEEWLCRYQADPNGFAGILESDDPKEYGKAAAEFFWKLANDALTRFMCQWKGCDRPATQLACGQDDWQGGGHPTPAMYCEEHAGQVKDEGCPEYTVDCPNCGCRFGVN